MKIACLVVSWFHGAHATARNSLKHFISIPHLFSRGDRSLGKQADAIGDASASASAEVCCVVSASAEVYCVVSASAEVYCVVSASAEVYCVVSASAEVYCVVSASPQVYCVVSAKCTGILCS